MGRKRRKRCWKVWKRKVKGSKQILRRNEERKKKRRRKPNRVKVLIKHLRNPRNLKAKRHYLILTLILIWEWELQSLSKPKTLQSVIAQMMRDELKLPRK